MRLETANRAGSSTTMIRPDRQTFCLKRPRQEAAEDLEMLEIFGEVEASV